MLVFLNPVIVYGVSTHIALAQQKQILTILDRQDFYKQYPNAPFSTDTEIKEYLLLSGRGLESTDDIKYLPLKADDQHPIVIKETCDIYVEAITTNRPIFIHTEGTVFLNRKGTYNAPVHIKSSHVVLSELQTFYSELIIESASSVDVQKQLVCHKPLSIQSKTLKNQGIIQARGGLRTHISETLENCPKSRLEIYNNPCLIKANTFENHGKFFSEHGLFTQLEKFKNTGSIESQNLNTISVSLWENEDSGQITIAGHLALSARKDLYNFGLLQVYGFCYLAGMSLNFCPGSKLNLNKGFIGCKNLLLIQLSAQLRFESYLRILCNGNMGHTGSINQDCSAHMRLPAKYTPLCWTSEDVYELEKQIFPDRNYYAKGLHVHVRGDVNRLWGKDSVAIGNLEYRCAGSFQGDKACLKSGNFPGDSVHLDSTVTHLNEMQLISPAGKVDCRSRTDVVSINSNISSFFDCQIAAKQSIQSVDDSITIHYGTASFRGEQMSFQNLVLQSSQVSMLSEHKLTLNHCLVDSENVCLDAPHTNLSQVCVEGSIETKNAQTVSLSDVTVKKNAFLHSDQKLSVARTTVDGQINAKSSHIDISKTEVKKGALVQSSGSAKLSQMQVGETLMVETGSAYLYDTRAHNLGVNASSITAYGTNSATDSMKLSGYIYNGGHLHAGNTLQADAAPGYAGPGYLSSNNVVLYAPNTSHFSGYISASTASLTFRNMSLDQLLSSTNAHNLYGNLIGTDVYIDEDRTFNRNLYLSCRSFTNHSIIKSFYDLGVTAQRGILNTDTIDISGNLGLDAGAGLDNFGVLLSKKNMSLRGQYVNNSAISDTLPAIESQEKSLSLISQFPKSTSLSTKVPGRGVVMAQGELTTEAFAGDITNHAGIMAGGCGVYQKASGSVVLMPHIQKQRGCYGQVTTYNSAYTVSGGDMVTQAGNKLVNTACVLGSVGDNIIDADNGIETDSLVNIYTAKRSRSDGLFSSRTSYEEGVSVGQAFIGSKKGNLIAGSSNGDIRSQGALWQAGNMLSMEANNLELDDVVYTVNQSSEQSGLFGISRRSFSSEQNLPTTMISKHTNLKAQQDIKGHNTKIYTSGVQSLEAGRDIDIQGRVLNHDQTYESLGFAVSNPLLNAGRTYQLTNNGSESLRQVDPLIGSVVEFGHSPNAGVALANTVEAGVELYGLVASIANPSSGNAAKEVLSRYTSIGLKMEYTHSRHSYQTVSRASLNSQNQNLKAGRKIKFGAVDNTVANNLSVQAPVFEMAAQKTYATSSETRSSLSVGWNPLTDNFFASATHSEASSNSMAHHGTHMSVGGNARLDVDTMKLSGGQVCVGKTVSGRVGRLEIETHINESNQQSLSFSVGRPIASSDVVDSASISVGHGHQENLVSGVFHANEGFQDVSVDELYLEGGMISHNQGKGLLANEITHNAVRAHSWGQQIGGAVGKRTHMMLGSGSYSAFDTREEARPVLTGSNNFGIANRAEDHKVVTHRDRTDVKVTLPFAFDHEGIQNTVNALSPPQQQTPAPIEIASPPSNYSVKQNPEKTSKKEVTPKTETTQTIQNERQNDPTLEQNTLYTEALKNNLGSEQIDIDAQNKQLVLWYQNAKPNQTTGIASALDKFAEAYDGSYYQKSVDAVAMTASLGISTAKRTPAGTLIQLALAPVINKGTEYASHEIYHRFLALGTKERTAYVLTDLTMKFPIAVCGAKKMGRFARVNLPKYLSFVSVNGNLSSTAYKDYLQNCIQKLGPQTVPVNNRLNTARPKIYTPSAANSNAAQVFYSKGVKGGETSKSFNKGSPSSAKITKTSQFNPGDNIDLSRFTERLKGGSLRDPKTGQILEKDWSRNTGAGPHGGSYWKLKIVTGQNEVRIGTITKEGKFLRK